MKVFVGKYHKQMVKYQHCDRTDYFSWSSSQNMNLSDKRRCRIKLSLSQRSVATNSETLNTVWNLLSYIIENSNPISATRLEQATSLLSCACHVVTYKGFTLCLLWYRQGSIRQYEREHVLQKSKAPAGTQCSKEVSATNELKTRKRAKHPLQGRLEAKIALMTSQASPSLQVSGYDSHLRSFFC